MITSVRSHSSEAYKVITPFCMTRLFNWKLAPIIQSYGGYHHKDLSSIQQNQPIANLDLLMIKLPFSGALFFKLIHMATISSLWNKHSSRTVCDSQLSLFPWGLRWSFTMALSESYSSQSPERAKPTQCVDANNSTQTRTPPPSGDQRLLARMRHSLSPSINTSHILNFSAKLMDIFHMIHVLLKSCFLAQLCTNHLPTNFHFLPFPRTPQSIFVALNRGDLSFYDYRSNLMKNFSFILL